MARIIGEISFSTSTLSPTNKAFAVKLIGICLLSLFKNCSLPCEYKVDSSAIAKLCFTDPFTIRIWLFLILIKLTVKFLKTPLLPL